MGHDQTAFLWQDFSECDEAAFLFQWNYLPLFAFTMRHKSIDKYSVGLCEIHKWSCPLSCFSSLRSLCVNCWTTGANRCSWSTSAGWKYRGNHLVCTYNGTKSGCGLTDGRIVELDYFSFHVQCIEGSPQQGRSTACVFGWKKSATEFHCVACSLTCFQLRKNLETNVFKREHFVPQ